MAYEYCEECEKDEENHAGLCAECEQRHYTEFIKNEDWQRLSESEKHKINDERIRLELG